MPGDFITNSGSIGSQQAELSRYILDSQDILEAVVFRLQGGVKLMKPDGTFEITQQEDRAYNNKVIAWMQGKLMEILNRNMYLSNVNKEEMYSEAKAISKSFEFELWLWMHDFGINTNQYKELCSLHRNFVSQTIRRCLLESDKRFLKETTSESTQKISQQISQEQERRGFLGLGGLLGGR